MPGYVANSRKSTAKQGESPEFAPYWAIAHNLVQTVLYTCWGGAVCPHNAGQTRKHALAHLRGVKTLLEGEEPAWIKRGSNR
jgi:hypothetical protein